MTTQATIDENKAVSEPFEWDLTFVKVLIPENVQLIPREIIEGVKGHPFTPEQFYSYQMDQMLSGNPGNLLYLLVSQEKKVEGVLWAEISAINNSMFINTFSVSKKYWHKGKAIEKAIVLLEKIRKQMNCPTVYWITTNDKFFLKHGFKRSKNVLMEYNHK